MSVQRFTCSYKQLNIILQKLESRKMKPILDNINEYYNKNNYYNIKKSIKKYPNNYFAVKLSSLGLQKIPDDKVYSQLDYLCKLAIKNNSKVLIDAENYLIQDQINDISNNLIETYNDKSVNVYKTYQMYRNDTLDILHNDFDKYDYLGIKLVRGAYENMDRKYGYIHDNKWLADRDYDRAIKLFFSKDNNHNIILATHNEESVYYSLELLNKSNQKYLYNRVKYAQLLGMGDNLSNYLVDNNMEVYKYVPYGKFHETIPYLLRRLYENYPVAMHIFK